MSNQCNQLVVVAPAMRSHRLSRQNTEDADNWYLRRRPAAGEPVEGGPSSSEIMAVRTAMLPRIPKVFSWHFWSSWSSPRCLNKKNPFCTILKNRWMNWFKGNKRNNGGSSIQRSSGKMDDQSCIAIDWNSQCLSITALRWEQDHSRRITTWRNQGTALYCLTTSCCSIETVVGGCVASEAPGSTVEPRNISDMMSAISRFPGNKVMRAEV